MRDKTKTSGPSQRVLAWWDAHRRILPWRAPAGKTPDPYAVWLSEILLQQTTVAAAAPYFQRLLAAWPDVNALAAAPDDDVMRAFAGLGYYSRARNLIACARMVAARGGDFPRTERELRELPGIGAYTAAAIAAIAFDEPAAPVDGNIARIVARLLALDAPIATSRRTIAEAAAALAPARRAGDCAQALMDLGSMVCTPRKPDCAACPLRPDCRAAASGDPEAWPRKLARKPRPTRCGAVFVARRADGAILVRRRPPTGLLAGTLELPGGEWRAQLDPSTMLSTAPVTAQWRALPDLVEQAFTHFTLRLVVHVAKVPLSTGAPKGCFWLGQNELAGFSSVMRKALEHGLRGASLAA